VVCCRLLFLCAQNCAQYCCNVFAGDDAQIVSPLQGAPGFVKAAAAATPAVAVPVAGPLASVAEHTNAAASAREFSRTSASSVDRSSGLAEAAQPGAGHAAGNGGGLSVATAKTAALTLGSQEATPGAGASDGLSGLADASQTQSTPGPGTSSGGGGGAAGLLSRYSMLAALPPGGVDRSGTGGPLSLGRDSMPAALGIQVIGRKVVQACRRRLMFWQRAKGVWLHA
jgi:hypothetical protein